MGTANGVSLVRRAQLAVIAHIRHVYTNYDNLLRSVPYMEARRRVEKLCLDHLIQWRGDDENRDNMDDILREVIVIPDDDEDQEAGGQTQEKGRPMHEQFGRDNSVEFISEGDMQTRPVDYSKTNREDSRNDSYSPESDSDVQYIGQGRIAPRPQPAYYQHNLDRMGNHWRRTWEEALDRRRNQPASLYAVDDSPSILTSRGFRHNQSLPKPQGLRERDDQFYLNDPVPQPGSRESGYRRVVHVQALDDRQSHRTERYSEGRESRIGPSDHVSPANRPAVVATYMLSNKGK